MYLAEHWFYQGAYTSHIHHISCLLFISLLLPSVFVVLYVTFKGIICFIPSFLSLTLSAPFHSNVVPFKFLRDIHKYDMYSLTMYIRPFSLLLFCVHGPGAKTRSK